MKKLKTIYKIAFAELQILFYSPIAWFILIIFTFHAGMIFMDLIAEHVRSQAIYRSSYNITMITFGDWRGLFTRLQSYLYMYIPLLTMGVISREFSSGSIKLLYSSPITNIQIVLGKYLSMMIYGVVLTGVLSLFSIFGIVTIIKVDIPPILSGLFGIYLLICTYMAIGIFMSSLTSYQIVAAMLTFAVLAVLSFVGGIWQTIPFIRDITYWLSINGRSQEMVDGFICSEDILYFITIIVFFLGLTVIRLNSKRQKIRNTILISRYLLLVVFAIMAGYLSSRPKLMAYYDTTFTKVRTLTPNSQKVLAKLDGGVSITTFVNILAQEFSYALPRFVNYDMDRFKRYRRFKPELKFKYIYFYDKTINPELDRYPNLTDRERMVQRANAWHLDTNIFMRPEELKKIIDLEPEQNRVVRLIKRENGQQTFLRNYDDMRHHPDESQITAAFKRLVMELPVVGFVKGHGERDSHRKGDRHYGRFTMDIVFRYALINNGFDLEDVTLEREVPEKISILVISDMQESLTTEEQANLDRYIACGGNLLIAGEPGRQEIMNPLVEPFGVRFIPGRLVKASPNFQPDLAIVTPTKAGGEFSYLIQEMIRYKYVATMPSCVGLEYDTDKGFDVIELFVSDTLGWNTLQEINFMEADTIILQSERGEFMKSYPTMLALSRKMGEKEQRIIVIGDADCISNSEISIFRKDVNAANYTLINASFYWLSDEEVPINVSRPAMPDRNLRLKPEVMIYWKIVFMGVLPGMGVFLLLFIWIRRRGR